MIRNIIGFLLIFLLISFFVITIILLIIRKFLLEKKFKENCESCGDIYYGDLVPFSRKMIKGTPLDQGKDQNISFGMGRQYRGLDVATFRWQYTTGNQEQTYNYKVAILYNIPFRKKGFIFIRKKSMLDRLNHFFHLNDLNFESSEFSKKYFVKAKPEIWGYTFFSPRMIELFLKHRFYPMIIKNGMIMFYTKESKDEFKIYWMILKGLNPFNDWIETTLDLFIRIQENIPKLLLK